MPDASVIALIVATLPWSNRQLLAGIASYAQQHAPWRFVRQFQSDGAVDKWLLRAKPLGVIAEVTSQRMAKTLQRLAVPVVDVLQEYPAPHIPQIVCDDRKIIQRAIDHLRGKGLRHLAFIGDEGLQVARQRKAWFCDHARLFNGNSSGDLAGIKPSAKVVMLPASSLLPEGLVAISEWLRGLPKPVGVVACNDEWAVQVLRSCSQCGFRVPDDIAVIGISDDPIYCRISDPPLSSIDCCTYSIGFQAAALLDGMIRRGESPQPVTFVEPGAVRERASTNVLAIADQTAVAALRFLREHACAGITPAATAAQLGVSRRTLDRLLTAKIGHSLASEIRRVRMERARELLATTDLPLSLIARRVGIPHAETLHRAFKRRFGTPPGFRRSSRVSQRFMRGDRRTLTTDSGSRRGAGPHGGGVP